MNREGNQAAGFVLAGGRSSRMGRDKALVDFAGQPMMAHAIAILRQAGLPVAIAGARSALEDFAPVVPDLSPDSGPLIGILSALSWTQARWSVFISVDLPLLPPSVVQFLLDHARQAGAALVVTATDEGYTETFPMVVDRVLLPVVQAAFDSGRSGCYAELRSAAEALGLPVAKISLSEAIAAGRLPTVGLLPPDCWFLNTNTQQELDRALSIWRQRANPANAAPAAQPR